LRPGPIGAEFVWDGCGGIVVETEAYAETGDAACHTFFRPSARRFVSEAEPGTADVYLNYGMYWLTNVLVKGGSVNGFVLIRALQPTVGIDLMRQRRGEDRLTDLCSGPGKLSAALGIGSGHHGTSLTGSPDRGFLPGKTQVEVNADVRIGISSATDLPWRFLAAGSDYVSIKPRGAVRQNPDPTTPGSRPRTAPRRQSRRRPSAREGSPWGSCSHFARPRGRQGDVRCSGKRTESSFTKSSSE